MNVVSDAKLLIFPSFGEAPAGKLTVYESAKYGIPFEVRRMFVVSRMQGGTTRGNHAHFRCHQLLVCLSGSVDVSVSDGGSEKTFCLTNEHEGLHIPHMLWSTQTYTTFNSVLAVFCSEPYSESEYIREYQTFLLARVGTVPGD